MGVGTMNSNEPASAGRAERASGFYVTGGTLRHDAPCYVERRADRDLASHLGRGEFCYVLTSRQMGKSSLMVRTATRLRQSGWRVAVLDLTSIGQNVTAEQWYGGLLGRVGAQLDVEDDLEAFWEANRQLGPMQRWVEAIQSVVLRGAGGGERPLAVFVDEIDAVRSLGFSTDEFFGGIRECYNRRAAQAEFRRLAFCLLGVAMPSDLIRDNQVTPFNIGQRIELTDFTPQEAEALVSGLGRGHSEGLRLLKRVLHWTNGHPYLTQALCQGVARRTDLSGPVGVDRLCGEMFLSARARDADDNLLFVREWLLRSPANREQLLDLYARVHRGERVVEDSEDAVQDVLRLSGVVRGQDGQLRIRNRVYHRVFDQSFLVTHHSGALQRQQQQAYRRGVLKGGLAVVAGLVAIAGLVGALVVAARVSRATGEILAGGPFVAPVAKPSAGAMYASRDARATADQIDLAQHYNARLTPNWHKGERGNDLREFPTGLVEFEGIGFDVRGLIQVCAVREGSERYPPSVTGIRVGRTARRLHFLHSTIQTGQIDARIGSYVIRYSDGQSWEVPIVYGRHVVDWWRNPQSPAAANAPAPVWLGGNPALAAGLQVQVFLTTWTNPLPEVAIATVEFKGVPASRSHPFLLGLTVDDGGPGVTARAR